MRLRGRIVANATRQPISIGEEESCTSGEMEFSGCDWHYLRVQFPYSGKCVILSFSTSRTLKIFTPICLICFRCMAGIALSPWSAVTPSFGKERRVHLWCPSRPPG